MIYFLRTPSKTSISRKSSVIVFFLQLVIASDGSENQSFPFLGGTGGKVCDRPELVLACKPIHPIFVWKDGQNEDTVSLHFSFSKKVY